MKLTQYEPSVNKNIEQAKMNAVTNIQAYGGTGSEWNDLGKAVNMIYAEKEKEWLRGENNKVIDATNEYNRRVNSLLYDENEGLLQTMQGKQAEQVEAIYGEKENEIRQKVIKDFGIGSQYASDAFRKQVENDITAQKLIIDKYQRGEKLKYAGNQIDAINANIASKVAKDPDLFNIVYDGGVQQKTAIRASLGMDELAIAEAERKELNELAKTVLSTALDTENTKQGLAAIKQLRERKADESILKKYEKIFLDKETEKTTKAQSGDFLDKNPKYLNMPWQEVYAIYRKEHPLVVGTYADTPCGRIGKYIGERLNFDPSWGFAIASFESGHGKSAPRNNYFGIKWDGKGEYQELPTTECDADGNKKSVMAKFKVYNSPEESAEDYVQWMLDHTTEEERKNVKSAADLARLMKKHGYYTDDEKRYVDGVSPIASQYNDPNDDISEEERAALEEKRKDAFRVQFQEKVRERQQHLANLYDEIDKQVTNLIDQGYGPSDIYQYLQTKKEEYPELEDSPQFRSCLRTAKQNADREARGMARANEAENEKGVEEITNLIGYDIVNKGMLDHAIEVAQEKGGYSFSQRQINKMYNALNEYDIGNPKYHMPLDKKEIAAYAQVKESEISNMVMGLIRRKIAKRSKNADGPLSHDDQLRVAEEILCQQKMTEKPGSWWHEFTNGLIGDKGEDVTASKADLAGMHITKIGRYSDSRMLQVSFDDGSETWMTPEQFEELKQGRILRSDIIARNYAVDQEDQE